MLATRLRLSLGVVLMSGLIGLGAYGLAQAPPAGNTTPPPEVVRVQPGQTDLPARNFNVAENPFVPDQQKVEKIAAKGIEDDDVPFPATPTQAVVRVEEGKLIVRQRGFHYAATTVSVNGQNTTSYQRRSGVQASTYDPADVSVFDMKGNRLQAKAWKEKLKNDVHVLVAFDGRLPNPRELALFKEDTLMVVLPAMGTTGVHEYTIPPLPATAPPANRFTPPAPPALPSPPGRSGSVRPAAPPAPPTIPPPPTDLPPQPE